MTEARDEEDRRLLEMMQGYKRKRPYRAVFGTPDGDWNVEANWEDAYYGAALAIVSGVVEGRYPRGVEGVTGLYLFRHYVELALKYIILHARWLKDPKTNAKPDEIQEVKKIHSLARLWAWAKDEAKPKIEETHWREWDIEFVDACITEWEAIDPHPGERFRYHGRSFGGAVPARHQERLWIDFRLPQETMPHVREDLGMIDLYLYETHGMNEEWEAEMASW